MNLDGLREIYHKVNSDIKDGVIAADITIDLARYTKELERRWHD